MAKCFSKMYAICVKAHSSGRMVSSDISDVVTASVTHEKKRLKKLMMKMMMMIIDYYYNTKTIY